MVDQRGGTEPIGEVLSRLLADLRLLSTSKQEQLVAAWSGVAGPFVSRHSRVLSYKAGTLTIGVDSAPLRQELEVYGREELLAALRERCESPFVQDLRFRLM